MIRGPGQALRTAAGAKPLLVSRSWRAQAAAWSGRVRASCRRGTKRTAGGLLSAEREGRLVRQRAMAASQGRSAVACRVPVPAGVWRARASAAAQGPAFSCTRSAPPWDRQGPVGCRSCRVQILCGARTGPGRRRFQKPFKGSAPPPLRAGACFGRADGTRRGRGKAGGQGRMEMGFNPLGQLSCVSCASGAGVCPCGNPSARITSWHHPDIWPYARSGATVHGSRYRRRLHRQGR